jgi:hypothetical protein
VTDWNQVMKHNPGNTTYDPNTQVLYVGLALEDEKGTIVTRQVPFAAYSLAQLALRPPGTRFEIVSLEQAGDAQTMRLTMTDRPCDAPIVAGSCTVHGQVCLPRLSYRKSVRVPAPDPGPLPNAEAWTSVNRIKRGHRFGVDPGAVAKALHDLADRLGCGQTLVKQASVARTALNDEYCTTTLTLVLSEQFDPTPEEQNDDD